MITMIKMGQMTVTVAMEVLVAIQRAAHLA